MKKIVIIGSDSFIAGKFINSIQNQYSLKLFTRQLSNRSDELLVYDLMDITNEDMEGTDVVINFAAVVHQPNLKDKKLYNRINTELPVSLAKEAKKAGIKHFIQMSSIAVYGNTESIDINSIENPQDIYGESKLNADKALLSLQDETFKVAIVRPPMVYGGGKAPGNLLKLIKFSQKGYPLPFKKIKNKRDFIHVGNLIQALNIIIEKELKGIFIPTDKRTVSTEEIVNLIKKYSSNKVRLIYLPDVFLKIIKFLKPSIYWKVFGSLEVKSNLPENIYFPKKVFDEGIREMVQALYN